MLRPNLQNCPLIAEQQDAKSTRGLQLQCECPFDILITLTR